MNNQQEEKVTKTSTKYRYSFIATVIISLTMSLVASLSVVAFYDQRYAQKIVTMDLQGYIREQRNKAVSGKISDEDLRKNIDTMEAALLAEPANHVVLLKEVVLRNAREIKP